MRRPWQLGPLSRERPAAAQLQASSGASGSSEFCVSFDPRLSLKQPVYGVALGEIGSAGTSLLEVCDFAISERHIKGAGRGGRLNRTATTNSTTIHQNRQTDDSGTPTRVLQPGEIDIVRHASTCPGVVSYETSLA